MKHLLFILLASISMACNAQSTSKVSSATNKGTHARAVASSASSTTSFGNSIDISSYTIQTSCHEWCATKIQLSESSTIVTKICQPMVSNTWIHSTGTEYIEDCDTGTRYYIRSSSIAMTPQKTTLSSSEPKAFTETYAALPSYVTRINICSGSSYYVRNLQIR